MPRRLPEAPEGGVQAALCGKHRQGRWFESTIRLLTGISVQRQQQSAGEQVMAGATSAATQIDAYLQRHVAGTRGAARSLEHVDLVPSREVQTWLREFHSIYPDFVMMVVADSSGRVVAATRHAADRPVVIDPVGLLPDRETFRRTMESGAGQISGAARPRGGRGQPIVTISEPVLIGGVSVGAVQGFLDTTSLSRLEHLYAPVIGAKVLIVDSSDRVIHAAPSLGLAPLSDLASAGWLRRPDASPQELFEVTWPVDSTAADDRFVVGSVETAAGWQVLMLVPRRTIITGLDGIARPAAIWLLPGLIAAVMFAIALSHGVSRPVRSLRAYLRDFDARSGRVLRRSRGTPTEFREVFTHLRRVSSNLRRTYASLAAAVKREEALRAKLEQALVERDLEIDARTLELKAANSLLERVARLDPLTGLANRRAFDEFVAQSWRASLRSQSELSLLFIDVDHFKRFNDLLGHQAGDDCLRLVAARLAASVRRPSDLVSRYGGEEFAVVLADTTLSGADEVAVRILTEIAAMPLPPQWRTAAPVTVSIGVATIAPRVGMRLDELVARADAALYEAKARGRNGICIDHDTSVEAQERMAAAGR